MDNVLDNIPERLDKVKEELENVELQLKHAETDVKKEFPDEEKLQQKLNRLNELNALLNVDKSENEIISDEKPEDDKGTEKEKEMER